MAKRAELTKKPIEQYEHKGKKRGGPSRDAHRMLRAGGTHPAPEVG